MAPYQAVVVGQADKGLEMKTYTIPEACLRKKRHVGVHDNYAQLLYNILLIPEIHTYLEIGCDQGVSTSAAAQARSERDDFFPAVCDIRLSKTVLDLTWGGFQRHRQRSWDVLAASEVGQWDCVFVDGDHTEKGVARDIEELKRLQVQTVIAHDTNNPRWPGPSQFVREYADWPHVHDTRWLGLFMASRDAAVWAQIKRLCEVGYGD